MTTRTAYGVPASGQGYLRASTVDRERAIDVIKAGYAEGRLSMPEYEARASQALAARTVADLMGAEQVGEEHVCDALTLRTARSTVAP